MKRSPNPKAAAHQAVRALVADLKCRRQELGLSLTALARRAGLDVAALCRLEQGTPANPTSATLGRWAAGLGGRLRLEWDDRA